MLRFYKKIISTYSIKIKGIKILQLFTVAFLGGILYFIGESQLSYIDEFETPFLISCTYYDDYGNILYSSQFFGICPFIGVSSKVEIHFST